MIDHSGVTMVTLSARNQPTMSISIHQESPLQRLVVILVWAIFLFVQPSVVMAHGETHAMIKHYTREIQKDPDNADLFLGRGELFRSHHEWTAAMTDYDHAARLNPDLDAIDFCRGKLLYEMGRPLAARKVLDAFIEKHPEHINAGLTRARTLMRLDPTASAEEYLRVIELMPNPGPDCYLEWAHASTASEPGNVEAALHCVDEGIKRLGPIVSLQSYAIDLELKFKRYDSALSRLERAAALSPHKEPWLARRAGILMQADRLKEARQAYANALEAITLLPQQRRKTKSIAELETSIRNALTLLN